MWKTDSNSLIKWWQIFVQFLLHKPAISVRHFLLSLFELRSRRIWIRLLSSPWYCSSQHWDMECHLLLLKILPLWLFVTKPRPRWIIMRLSLVYALLQAFGTQLGSESTYSVTSESGFSYWDWVPSAKTLMMRGPEWHVSRISLTWGLEWPVCRMSLTIRFRMTPQQKYHWPGAQNDPSIKTCIDVGPRMTRQQKCHWCGDRMTF